MNISMAISCIWAWLVPHFYIEFTEYRLALSRSPAWNVSAARRQEANQATVLGAGAALFCILVVTLASVSAISLPTRGMDRRADAIVVGLGRILSAFLFAIFSVVIPQWLGVTYSSQRGNYYKDHCRLSTTSKEVTFQVCWSLLGHFFVMYGMLLLYFCNPGPGTISVSTAIGIISGFGVVWGVWVGRTQFQNHTRLLAVILSMTIAFGSAVAFSAGCYYVKEVWYSWDDVGYSREAYTLITFFGWLGLCIAINCIYYRLTRRKLAEARTEAPGSVSETGSTRSDDAKKSWRYQSQVFQPPNNIAFAATELTKATAHAAVATVKGSLSLLPSAESFCSATARSSSTDSLSSNRVRTNTGSSKASFESDRNNNARDLSKIQEDEILNSSITEMSRASTRGTHNPTYHAASASEQLDVEDRRESAEMGLPDIRSGTAQDLTESSPSENPKLRDSGIEDSQSINDMNYEDDNEKDEHRSIPDQDPSLWFMIKSNTCCGRRKYYKAPPRKPWERTVNVVKWTLWIVTTGLHVYLTIINIGATVQQNAVRAALPYTYETFYPPNYITGTMCAWNESSPNADIRTFDTLDDVTAANYSVIHCGACGNCSNWNDLSLQWTTRTHLADSAQECTQKSLFGGSVEDVQLCNEELLGFTEDCAWCWTMDQLCASTKCVFIFLQSVVINQVSNFHVGPDDITTATCDEALCGPQFIPCSGATRRRMDIQSDIPRPANQQCTVANEDWATIFDHP